METFTPLAKILHCHPVTAVTNFTSDKDTVNETVPAQNCSDTSVIHTLIDIFRTSIEFAESDAVFAKRTISFLFSLRCLLPIYI